MQSASTPSFLCLRHQASAKLGHPLRGCGVPEDFITYLPLLIGTMPPIQYQSCFISDRSQDEEFARRLHEKMRGEKLRVWFAPEDMQGGQKLIEPIDRAIQVNDRLLLVLSEHSMNWKNHDAFESAFADLLRDLLAQAQSVTVRIDELVI
ncbi:MAG: toll/interleukin-1 receptor domain-containing protein [Planctomycetaceae bacterium]